MSENETSFFSNNCLGSKISKGQGECNFDKHAENKRRGRKIPAYCRKMIKILLAKKKQFLSSRSKGHVECRLDIFTKNLSR